MAEDREEAGFGNVLLKESPFPIIILLLAISLFIYFVEQRIGQFYTEEMVVDLTKHNTFIEEDPIEQTTINIPSRYKPFIEEKDWDSVLNTLRTDTAISSQEKITLTILAYYNKREFDSVIAFVKNNNIDPNALPPEICLYYAFSLYQSNPSQSVELINNCLSQTKNQNLYIKAVNFLIKHFESDASRHLLLKSDSFITARYRPYWHYYMGLTYALEGSRDSAIWHLQQAINYKPDWIKPRLKLVELLPNTEEGLRQKEELLLEVIRLRPSYAPAHYMLALVRHRQGKGGGLPTTDSILITEDFSPEVLVQRVRAEISAGNYKLARKYLQDLISIDSTNPYTLFLIGNWYRAVDSLEEARDWYVRALRKAHFRFPEAWLNLGITYRRLGKTDSAIYAYKQALKYRNDYHEALFNLGVAYWHADSINKAHQIFKQLSELTPDHDRTWYFLARTYERLGNTGSAIIAYRKALEINPFYRKALIKLSELDNSNETIHLLENYLSNNPSDVKILRMLGDLYTKRKEYAKSVKFYEQVLKYDPDNTSVLRSLAKIYQRLGDTEKALRYWEEVLDRKPGSKVARRQIAKLYLALGDTSKAIKHLEKLIRIEPERLETWNQLIALYKKKGWVVRPTNRLSAVWREDLPESGRLAYEIASFARKAEKYETAKKFYREALEKGYRKHWSAFWMGRIYLNEGDTTNAIKYFNLAVKEKEDFGLSWKRLAQLYLSVDSLDKATQALQRAKALRPNDPDLIELEKSLKLRIP
ncbi:MAG: tetratricopeptide repeat protein [Chlorobi bacterium]|nr:tetratricopeptide repeat protein [Chlorobiota bacterium]